VKTRKFVRLGLLSAVLVAAPVAALAGDDTSTSTQDDKIARLEALIQAQQQKIDALQQQVTSANSQDMEAARLQAMREQIREVLSEREFRESLMPSVLLAGYDEGFYIRSSDDLFSLKINGYMQFRWTHYGTRSRNRYLLPRLERDDRTGFDMQRLRLALNGHAWSEDLTYHLTLRAEAPDGYDMVVHYAWANYRFADEFQVTAGIFQLASLRAELLADQYGLQFVDRGLVHSVFGLGIGTGVRFWGQLFEKQVDWYVDVVNSLNGQGNRTITTDPAEHDNHPAILARLVWHVMGDDPTTWARENDLPISETPAWDLGFSYAFNDDKSDLRTTRLPFPATRGFFGRGGYGLTNTNGTQIHQFSVDTAFKYMGFSAIGEYVFRTVDPRRAGRLPFTPYWLLTGQADTTVYHGAYAQLGYFLPIPGMENQVEAVARVGGISTMGNGTEGSWEYGAGLNYYLKGNAVKIQTDVIKIYEAPISSSYSSLANVNDDALVWRVQLQVAF